MKNHFWRNFISLAMILTFVISGCATQNSQSGGSSNTNLLSLSAASCDYGGEIKSVEAVDDYTVKFTLCSSDASFPAKMASPIFAVQDKDFLDSHNGDSVLLTQEVNGTGPFTLITYDPDLPIELKVSSSYWGTPPRITNILFHFYRRPESSIPTSDLSVADVLNTIRPIAVKGLQNRTNFSGIEHQALNLVYIGFNNSIKPFDDQNVRKAFAMIIDRTALAQKYLPSGTEIATQLIPASIDPGRSATLSWYDLNPTDGVSTLRSAGFDFNQVLTIAYVDGAIDFLDSPSGMASDIQKQLKDLNINVELKPMTQKEFNEAMANGTEMMFIDSYQALYVDGAAFYELPFVYHPARFGTPYTEIQQYLTEAQSEISSTTRQEKFDSMNQTFKDLVPLIPVGHVPQWSFFRNTVSSASTNAYFENYEDFSNQALTLQVYEAYRPESLWPADEKDYDTFRITKLLYDTLVTNGYGVQGLQPSLADSWESNTDATEWTFYLRYNVKFTNGASLDANDVVASFISIWDASSTNHKGRTGEFTIYQEMFGNLLNTK